MKTKLYTDSLVSLEKDERKKVFESMTLIEHSLEKNCFPKPIPENTGSAHIIYNDSSGGFYSPNYMINFFEESDPERANVSTGYYKFFSEDLIEFLNPEKNPAQ